MLPVPVQFIVAMLAYALNERMARKGEYLREENRVLKEALHAATGKSRIPLTNEQRRRLATPSASSAPFGTWSSSSSNSAPAPYTSLASALIQTAPG
jgi:hypothetical protein